MAFEKYSFPIKNGYSSDGHVSVGVCCTYESVKCLVFERPELDSPRLNDSFRQQSTWKCHCYYCWLDSAVDAMMIELEISVERSQSSGSGSGDDVISKEKQLRNEIMSLISLAEWKLRNETTPAMTRVESDDTGSWLLLVSL